MNEEFQEFYLERKNKGSWAHIHKSYESASLVTFGKRLVQQHRGAYRVRSKTETIWEDTKKDVL